MSGKTPGKLGGQISPLWVQWCVQVHLQELEKVTSRGCFTLFYIFIPEVPECGFLFFLFSFPGFRSCHMGTRFIFPDGQ